MWKILFLRLTSASTPEKDLFAVRTVRRTSPTGATTTATGSSALRSATKSVQPPKVWINDNTLQKQEILQNPRSQHTFQNDLQGTLAHVSYFLAFHTHRKDSRQLTQVTIQYSASQFFLSYMCHVMLSINVFLSEKYFIMPSNWTGRIHYAILLKSTCTCTGMSNWI